MQPTECARSRGGWGRSPPRRGPDAGLGPHAAVPPAQAAHGRHHARATPSRAPRTCSPGSSATAPARLDVGPGRGGDHPLLRSQDARRLLPLPPAGGAPWHGTYTLTLRRRGSFLESVEDRVLPDRAELELRSRGQQGRPPLRIHDLLAAALPRLAPAGVRQLPRLPALVRAARQCEGFSDALALGEDQLGASRVDALVRQALGVVRKARRRAPISGTEAASGWAGEGPPSARATSLAGEQCSPHFRSPPRTRNGSAWS